MAEVLDIREVTKEYGSGAGRVRALRGIHLQVPYGEFISIMGPSGCGKSTLLNMMAALDDPTSGDVFVCGENLAKLSERARSDLRLRKLGFIFQSFNLLPRLTVEHNITWRLEQLGVGRGMARRRARAALERVGVPETAWSRYPSELSGGEQQRVATARALANEPELVLADEPTGNLDSASGTRILDLLGSLNVQQGMSVVLVTHDTLAATYGQRTVRLRDGRVVDDVGSLEESRAGRVVSLPGKS